MQVEWKAQPGPIHGVGSENEQVTDLGCVWMLKESSLFPPESPPGMTGAWTCWQLWFSHLFPLLPLEKVQPQSERGPHRKRSQMNSGRERERGTLLTWVWFLNTALPKAICACFPPLWVTLFPLLWNQFELGLCNFQPKEFQLTHLLLRYVVKIKWDHFSKRFKTAPSTCLVNTGFHYCRSCSHVAVSSISGQWVPVTHGLCTCCCFYHRHSSQLFTSVSSHHAGPTYKSSPPATLPDHQSWPPHPSLGHFPGYFPHFRFYG